MANSPNKGYSLQTTGTNIGTWGTILNNSVISTIDNNLGGTLNINVAGNSNINLTASQASYLIHNLTGALTGNINYIFPAAGGIYFINNQTTGVYTVTVQVVGGSGGIVVPQGQSIPLAVDASTPVVEAFTGTQYVYSAVSVGGTANAVIIETTTPASFVLNTGTLLFFTPILANTGSTTITTPDGSTKFIQKEIISGLVNLQPDDLFPGIPIIAYYNGEEWLGLNIIIIETPYLETVSTNQSVGFGNAFTVYVNTAPITYTLNETTTMAAYWNISINAFGGAATITPNAADVINVNGAALSAGASYALPAGQAAVITTDADGNLYVQFNAAPLDSIGSTQGDILYRGSSAWSALAPGTSGQILQSGGAAANPSWTTALASGTTAITQAANDDSTKVATTAYVDTARPLGAWSTSFVSNTIYQAATDGFLVITVTAGANVDTSVISDSASSPTTTRLNSNENVDYPCSLALTCPIRKGDYWKVKTNGTASVLWIPLGN